MRTRLTFLLTAGLVLAMSVPAIAITNGAPDETDGATFDAVGNLLFFVPEAVDPRFEAPGSWFTCTGTLIEDDVVVTAGHCTYAIGEGGAAPADAWSGGTDVWITFDADANDAYDVLPNPSSHYAQREADGDTPDGNAERYAEWSTELNGSTHWHEATAHSHPSYVDAAFFLYDLGVLELAEPKVLGDGNYGVLPEAGVIDSLQTARRNEQLFTAVGYGIQEIVPRFQADDVRYEGTVRFLTAKGTHGINGILPGTSAVFSNNNGKAARGGTCFGDSGGPIFFGTDSRGSQLEDGPLVLAGVTSYGVSPNCTGTGGVYRIDKPADLAWINGFPRDEE